MVKEKYRQVDDGLIDRVFQPVVDCVAERTSLNCYTLARLCIDLSAFAWVLSQSSDIIAAIQSGNSGPAAFRATLLLLGLGSLMVLRTLFQRSGAGNQCANPLRGGMHVHRFVCLFWVMGLIFKVAIDPSDFDIWAALASGLCGTSAVYFAACSNRPPVRRSVRGRQDGWMWAKAR